MGTRKDKQYVSPATGAVCWYLILFMLLLKGIAVSEPPEHTQPAISISVEASALGPGRPAAARLTALGQELLTRLFPKELASSGKVFGRISGSVQKDGTPSFELQATFQGIYHSVILLNSCQTCASPYNLKNVIKKHNPRT